MSAEGFAKLRELAEGLSPLKEKALKQDAEERRIRKEPFFSKLPLRLQDSVEVSEGARLTFAALHRFSVDKQLAHRPWVPVSMRELCRRRNLREDQVRGELRELEKAGWIDIKRVGFGEVNRYRLYESSLADREGPKRLAETARRIRRDREVQKRFSKPIRNPSS